MTSYGYDGSLTTQMTWQGPVSGNIDFAYDNDFRVMEQTINGADTLAFSYDDDGLLTEAGKLSISYDSLDGLLTGACVALI